MKKHSIIFQILFFALFSYTLIFFLKKPTLIQKDQNNIINVYVWGDFFNIDIIKSFEKRTGAKINLNYYLSNEELLTKIRGSNGECADIIFPSDYAIKSLIQGQYLERLERKKLTFLDELDPFVLNKAFDPKNTYSLPYAWEVYGIVANINNARASSISTIRELLEAEDLERIIMPNDPIENFCIASQGIFGNLGFKTEAETRQIIQAIKTQRERIYAYTDYQAKSIFSAKSSNLGFTRSSFYCLLADEDPQHTLKFTLASDGLFISIENIAIMKSSKNKDLIYQFINNIYQKENMMTHIHECPAFPAIASLAPKMQFNSDYLDIYTKAKKCENLCFFNYYINEKRIRKEWVKIKAT